MPLGETQPAFLVEMNIFQSGTQISASAQQVALFQTKLTGSASGQPTGIGTQCDGNASVEGVLGASSNTFDLKDNGPAGQGDFSGEITFQNLNEMGQPGISQTDGNFSISGSCSVGNSGSFNGFLLKPFSGTYAGMLNSRPVILTMNQGANYSFSASGTDNASAITLSGQVIGGAFFASDGAGNSYTGIYDPSGNDFLVYGSNFTFLGQLNAGSNPAAASP